MSSLYIGPTYEFRRVTTTRHEVCLMYSDGVQKLQNPENIEYVELGFCGGGGGLIL